MFCKRGAKSECFRTGHWYEDGTTLPKGGQCGVVQCEAGAWRYRSRDCPAGFSQSVTFVQRRARIEPRSHPVLKEMAKFALKYPRFGVSVTAYADVHEACNAADLARRRAEAVEHALHRWHQIPPKRIATESRVLRGEDTLGPGKGSRLPRSRADIKLIDPPLEPGSGPP